MKIFKQIKKRLNIGTIRRLYLTIRYRFIVPNYDGMMDEAKCKFLYDIVMNYSGKRGIIVEIGAYKGCSTTWLAIAAKRNNFQSLIAIDLFTGTPSWKQKFDTYKVFICRMKKNKLETFVKPIRGDSRDIIKDWAKEKKITILHLDGDHIYELIKADIENYTPYLEHNGVVIFDDYDSEHPDVTKAVHDLLNSGKFRVINITPEVKKGYGNIALQKVG